MTDMEPVEFPEEPVTVEISTPPFSSDDPATEGLRMVPIVDDSGVGEDESIRSAGLAEAESAEGGEDASGKTAAEWVDEIKATTTQEELDTVLDAYAQTGKSYSTVASAAEAKQAALDAEA